MLYGDLQDPYKEFFVDIIEDVSNDEIWTNRYVLILNNVPNFFNKNVTKKIFEIGKCVNFIRKYCNQPTYSLLKLKTKLTMEIENEDRKNQKIENNENNENIENQMQIDHEIYTHKSILNEEFSGQKIYGNYKKCLDLILHMDSEEKMNMSILPFLNS
jgi:hypothetical protein